MSFSDSSTLALSRDNDGHEKSLDNHARKLLDFTFFVNSPYVNAQIVTLNVGAEPVRFDIHSTILRQSAKLSAKVDYWSHEKQSVSLPELDEATAHTIVHYLYTGRYQALQLHEQDDIKMKLLEYKLGTCVYCAAAQYDLPGLADLAKVEVASLSDDVDIFDILAMAREFAFKLLPDNDAWYPMYLEEAVQVAMLQDPEPFRKPSFIAQIGGNMKLLQIVWKTGMNNFTRFSEPALSMDNKSVSSVSVAAPAGEVQTQNLDEEEQVIVEEEVTGDKPQDDEIMAPAVDESAPEEEAPTSHPIAEPEPTTSLEPATHPEPAPKPTPPAAEDEEIHLEAIDPIDQTPRAPEPFTDELDFHTSKTYQQMGKKADVAAPSTDTPSSSPPAPALTTKSTTQELKKPTHTRSDSVLQLDDLVVKPTGEVITVGEASLAEEIVQPVEEEQNTTGNEKVQRLSKKALKKQKKLKKAAEDAAL